MTPKQQANIVARLVAQQVEKHAETWRKQTAQEMYSVMLLVLHDKFSFTPDMLIKCFNEVVKQFECLNGKYAKIEDFYKLLEELGVKVK